MNKVEKMNTSHKKNKDRCIYQGERSRKDNKPLRGRKNKEY